MSHLTGQTILLVEDEALIALELQFDIEDAGAHVVGPATSLAEAMRLARDAPCAAAILDIDLSGEDVYPAADRLVARNIPFVFHTGHGERAELAQRYPSAPVCPKPTASGQLLKVLASLL